MAGVALLAGWITPSTTALVHHHVLQGYEKMGYYSVQLMRRSFDLLTGYRPNRSMSEEKWLQRILFLETVAGEPCRFLQSAGPQCQHITFKLVLCLDNVTGMSISGCNEHASSSCGVPAGLHPVASVVNETVALRPPSYSQAAAGGRVAGGVLTSTGILHPQCKTVTWISGCVKPIHSECQLSISHWQDALYPFVSDCGRCSLPLCSPSVLFAVAWLFIYT